MGATYTRQSSSNIVDGNVIEASDLNNEFNQLLAAFVASSGHTHDGTAAEGGPITKLLGNTLTFGAGTAGTDITITFDGETSDGVFKWMEDEDYFEFSDDLLVASTEKLQFRDTAIYINSSADGQLDLVADTEIQIAATTIDINGAVALNGAITGATNITLSGELDAATLDISGNADIDGTLETDALSINGTAVTSTAAELNLVDGITAGTVSASLAVIADSNKDISGFRNVTLTGELDAATLDISGNADIDGTLETDALSIDGTTITSTAAEINILDGDNSASTVTIADADRIILNDGGTMKQVAVSALNTYTSSSIAADNIGTGDAAVTIATSSGNITIDAQAGDADIIFKGTDSSSDITALTLDMSAAGAATFNDKIIATELDISGNVDIDGTLEADAITVNGATLAETISDTVGAMVSSNTETGITVAYQDGDNTLDFALGAAQTGITSITNTSLVVGRDADNDIDFATDNNIIFRAAGADQIVLKDGVLEPVADDDIALGTTGSKRFTNLFLSGAIVAGGGVTAGGNLNINGVFEIDVASGDPTIIFDTQGADKFHIAVDDSDSDNLVIKSGGTVGSGNGLKLDSSGNLTVTGEVQMTTLDIGGTNVAATAAELNIMDGNTSATSTTLADADRLVTNDNGTMVQVALSDVKTYLTSAGFSSEDPTALAIALG